MIEQSSQRPPWTYPTDALEFLATILGVDPATLGSDESTDKLKFHLEFNAKRLGFPDDESGRAEKLASIDKALVNVRNKYGRSVTLSIKRGNFNIVTLDKYERSDLDPLIGDFENESVLLLDVSIDKAKLLEHWKITSPLAAFKIFLYPNSVVRALSVPLPQLEKPGELLGDSTGERKIIILVPKHNIELNGDYLAVLGGETIAEWKDFLPPKNSEESKSRIDYVLAQATENLKWVHIGLDHLTPLQLKVDWTQPEDGTEGGPGKNDPIAAALYAQQLACSVLYMAGHSSSNQRKLTSRATAKLQVDNSWVATFAGDKHVAKFDIGDTRELGEMLTTCSTGNPWKTAQTIANLATWTYEEQSGVVNRLIVLQSVIASSIQNSDSSVNTRELVRRASEIHERVKWGWEAFVNERLDKYFSQVKELEGIVEATTKTYNEQVQSLSKGLIDNMLAAVAVVVGSFIAAIFKSPFESYVFLFGTGIYVAYLTIFPVAVGLSSIWQRFTDSRDSFATRKNDFAERLTKEQINSIVGNVETRETWFKRWFGVTAGLYALVLVLVIIAMFKVPGLIKTWSDRFELNGVSYGTPTTNEVVPLIVRGENFDKEKEIVVTIGDSGFTNTDGQTLKVHGSTILTLSPRQNDLIYLKETDRVLVLVKQGSAGPKEVPLPSGPVPILRPAFQKWSVTAVRNGAVAEARGINFGSISDIKFSDQKRLSFKVSDNETKLELNDNNTPSRSWIGKSLEVTLKNGERLGSTILPSAK